MKDVKQLRILTWHVHGSYLYYLTQVPCQWILPKRNDTTPGYGGKTPNFTWGENVHEVDVDKIKETDFDAIIFQSPRNFTQDQYEVLTEEQRKLPKIYIEHDPPREVPTDTKHIVDDNQTTIVHVTHFNRLMWDNNQNPTAVLEHGVIVPQNVSYTGELEKGIVVVNGLKKRGRRLGLDIFEQVKKEIPLDIVGMYSEEVGGLGEVKLNDLPAFTAKYRFFFNPIRYTSMGLAVCEAMMTGIPVIGLATTEMAVNIENNVSGFVHTNVDLIMQKMKELLQNKEQAIQLGNGAKKFATEHFNIQRFSNDWVQVIQKAINEKDFNAEKERGIV